MAGHRGRHRHGRVRRARDHRRGDGAGAGRGARGHQEDRRPAEAAAAARRASRSGRFAKKEIDPGFVAWAEAADGGAAARGHADAGQARVLRAHEEGQGRLHGPLPGAGARTRRRWSPPSTRRCARRSCAARSWRTGAATTAARFDEIRTIHCEVGVLPRTHGSALFTRGETQALVTVTLGTSEDMQIIDTVQEPDHKKRFMLHYNFPPFSVAEVKFLRGPGRREIGHGALAERSLREMLPDEESFPYTVRIVSDILESNGSSSMASICGGTLALLDAGVPMKRAGGRRGHGPGEGRRQGTPSSPTSPASRTTTATWTSRSRARATASPRCRWTSRSAASAAEILAKALEQARVGRLHILDEMAEALAEAAHQHQHLRAAHPHHPGPRGQDPRHHRARRQDDPLDRRADRLQDRRRGRRARVDRLGGRGRGPQGHRHHRGAHRHRRAEQDLPGQGRARGGLRRLRRDPARHRRPAARLRDGRTTACRTSAAR